MKEVVEALQKKYCSLLDALISRKVGLSQITIAKAIGYTGGYISGLRNKKDPTKDQYEKIIDGILKKYATCVRETPDGLYVPIGPPSLPTLPLFPAHDCQYHGDTKIEILLEKHTNNGEKELRVLDTWIEASDFFLNWLNQDKLLKVTVLVLHPFGKAFKQRAEGISSEEGRVERIRQAYLVLLNEIIDKPFYNERLHINLYDEIPGLNCYFIGETVYFAPYLIKQTSYNNFYLSSTSGELIEQLSTHFEKIVREFSVPLTRAIMDEFMNKRHDISILSDAYIMYNLDESSDTPYQIAMITVDKKSYSGILQYEDRKTGSLNEVQGSIEFLEVPNHLFFSFRKGAFILDILCYYSRRADFIQAVYLHTDLEGRPRTAFGILKKRENGDPERPSRNAADMPDIIRKFLMRRFENTPQIEDDFSSMDELDQDLTANYLLVRKYVGTWILYYNVRLSRNKNFKNNPAAGEIAKSILEIKEDSQSGKISCRMDAHDGKVFEGDVMYHRHLANSDDILGIMLHDKPKEKRILNLVFDTSLGNGEVDGRGGIKETLRGTYNITYTNRTQGCGFAILKWAGEGSAHQQGVIDPLSEEGRAIPLPLKHLAFKHTGLLVEPPDREKKDNFSLYSGAYNMYNYGIKATGSSEIRLVIRSAMEITDFGLVVFKGLKDIQAYGYAQVHNGNMYIELQSSSQMNRIGYFILYVGDDRTIEEGTILTGVYSGITIDDRIPIGKRIILEKTGKKYSEIIPKKFLPFEDQDGDEIPECIRRVLAGNLKNTIGFLKNRRRIFNRKGLKHEIESTEKLGGHLTEAAYFKIWDAETKGGEDRLDQAIAEGIKLLGKAVSHGFTSINLFKETVGRISEKALLKMQDNEEFKVLERIARGFSKRMEDEEKNDS